MNSIQQLIENPNWQLDIEVDPNTGGDGQRVRVIGDTNSFRAFAGLLSAMADTVDASEHPSSETGYHLAFNPDEIPQLTLKNASILTLNCSLAER